MTYPDCNGEGFRIVCPDDMCRAVGECMHGDGEAFCYACEGEGEIHFDREVSEEE